MLSNSNRSRFLNKSISRMPATRIVVRAIATIALLGALLPHAARADALDTIRQRGMLVWGGDQEGGAPYVFPDPKDPERLLGFEVELADMLAAELGVKAKFQQG